MNRFLKQSEVNRQATRKGISVHDFLLERQKKYGKQTGVKFSADHRNDGYDFHPVDDGVCAYNNDELALKVEEIYWNHQKSQFVPQYMTYVEMWECLGKSDFELVDVIGTVKWMEGKGKALRTVDRMGKGYAFKMKEK